MIPAPRAGAKQKCGYLAIANREPGTWGLAMMAERFLLMGFFMKYRVLGKTGLRVGVIGMGTWQFGGEWGKDFSQEEVTGMVRRAMEVGINLIDTAECYGDHLSERLIGGALVDLRARGKFVVATKFGHRFAGNFKREEPRGPEDVEEQLDASLAALGTDYIDLYQYHSWGDEQFFSQEVRSVLEKARRAGKILHIGNSLAARPKTVRQIEQAGDFGVEAVQLVYNRLSREAEDRMLPMCEKAGLGVLARVPLASGFLTGKYKPGARFGEHDVRGQWAAGDAQRRILEAEQVSRTEVPAGTPMGRWALAWCLRHAAVTCVIPGCKSVEQVEDNARAAEMADEGHPLAAG